MTPAINAAKKARISFQIHEYEHNPLIHTYGEEAVEKLNISNERVFKTLVVHRYDSKELFVTVIPVSQHLDLKKAASILHAKKVKMADPKIVEKTTGYIVGGISPIGQKKQLKTLIDISATKFDTVFVSAGHRGLEIELTGHDLCTLTTGTLCELTQSSHHY
ncbi:Cys-tRNA(Pro)/Cys-tRNA(Cys) deacylase YbaK [invertebrate metagenome]|uniref:Cys-tRNA(Pro)/Cys-tRNA(Cys) deacylase YbaK n=1 Tax=invertebrate metagenome TaxID=1711999 RepID=A0A2H9T921_9ZZZZ